MAEKPAAEDAAQPEPPNPVLLSLRQRKCLGAMLNAAIGNGTDTTGKVGAVRLELENEDVVYEVGKDEDGKPIMRKTNAEDWGTELADLANEASALTTGEKDRAKEVLAEIKRLKAEGDIPIPWTPGTGRLKFVRKMLKKDADRAHIDVKCAAQVLAACGIELRWDEED